MSPAGIKTVATWFPAKERALAIGIFNAGTNVGAILTPLIVFLMVPAFGWRMTFVLTGVLGLLWLVSWLLVYRDDPAAHPKVGAAEVAHIASDPADPETRVGGLWIRLLAQRETWRSRSANSSSIRSGGSICSGCPAIWATNIISTSRTGPRPPRRWRSPQSI
ncbi:MAG: MFS transporter [Hyphomicrobium sp.]